MRRLLLKDLRKGLTVHIAGPNDFEVIGVVISISKPECGPKGYVDVKVRTADGDTYLLGTGGSLGDVFTMYEGTDEYFVEGKV